MKIKLTENQLKHIHEVLGDDIPDYMKDIIKKRYKGDYLSQDVPQHTSKIPNVNIEVKNEEVLKYASNQLINSFSNKLADQMKISEIWKEYSTNQSGNFSFLYSPFRILIDTCIPNIGEMNIYQKFTYFYSKEFRLPDSRLNDDSTLKVSIDKNTFTPSVKISVNVKWSNNKTGISGFLTAIKRVFPETFGYLDVEKITRDKHFVGLRNPIINYQENIKNIGTYSLFLYISDKPDDKLRMSISQFYDSCQNIYTGGDEGTEWNKKLLSNVFDKNSKVAYLLYNQPYKDTKGNEHPFTSIARCILRVNKNGGVMFDKVYPNNLQDLFYKVITENTGIENVGKSEDVYDYENVAGLPAPYMDKYKLRTSGSSNEEKMNVLSVSLNVEANEITSVDDETYIIKNRYDGYTKFISETWKVITLSEGVERASDSIRNNFLDMYREYTIDEVIGDANDGIIDGIDFLQVIDSEDSYNIYANEKNVGGKKTNIVEFLRKALFIEDVEDMNRILTGVRVNSSEWFSGNINIDAIIDGFVDSYGNDGRLRFVTQTLIWNNDEVRGYNNFIFYRTDYVMK